MTITASELRTIGNERTGRSEAQADIDKFVKSWVADLSSRGIVLEAEEELTFVDEQPNYVESGLTNLFKKIAAITVEDTDGNEEKPCMEISWQRYKERIAQYTQPGKPKEYARFNKTLFFWPPPKIANYPKANVSGTIHHADSTTISYADRFREAGAQYIIGKIQEKYLGPDHSKTKGHFALYDYEARKLKALQDNSEVNVVGYNDI